MRSAWAKLQRRSASRLRHFTTISPVNRPFLMRFWRQLRRHHVAGGRLGTQRRRVGHHPPLQTLRKAQLQPGGGRRQPHEAHEHCHEAAVLSAVPLSVLCTPLSVTGFVQPGSSTKSTESKTTANRFTKTPPKLNRYFSKVPCRQAR